MTRVLTIAGVAGLVGLLIGFLWLGRGVSRMQAELRALQNQRVAAEVAREKLKGVEARLEEAEDELRRERERRVRLESLVSQGRR